MSVFFDSSVLVAAMIEDETHHEACAEALRTAETGFVATHSLAECFAILSGGRLAAKLTPGDAARMVRVNVIDRLTPITLTSDEYAQVIESAEAAGVRGGAIYDLLLLAAARKCKANEILTLNLRHFLAFAPDLAGRIKQP